MSSFPSILKASLGALALVALAGGLAQAAEPSAAAIDAATRLFTDIGMKPTLDEVVPVLFIQLERNVTKTNPELMTPLHATLLAIEPDFLKSEDTVLNESAKVLASSMTEQELKDTVAFFESPTGKKFLSVQPAVLQQVAALTNSWRDKLSADILERARVEMKKKGYTF